MDVSHRFVDTNGIRMHIAEEGEGPLVVLCHGFPESWYSWRHQLDALAQAGFHAVAPDQRGYGQTDAPEDAHQYTQLHLVADIVGLISHFDQGPAVVVGHDWGAPVAWNTALFRPDLVRGVVGLSAPYVPRGDVDTLTALTQLIGENNYQAYFQQVGVAEANLAADPRTSLRRLLYTASADNPKQSDLSMPEGSDLVSTLADTESLPAWLTEDDLDFFVAEFTRTGFHCGLNWYRNSRQNWELTAPSHQAPLSAPALYIGGDEDLVVNWPGIRDYLSIMNMFVPNLTKAVLLDRCGHWTQQERPSEVNELLLEFLQTVS